MAEWQQYLPTVFFGVVFSFLLAKLFSVIFAFHDDNLRLTRSNPAKPDSKSKPEYEGESPTTVPEENEPLLGENEGPVMESGVISDHSDSDDDWEGVESTELDETFSAATAFVAATAADRAAQKVSNEMTARAKWQAWQKLGAMPPEEAMQKYIDIVTELFPSWAADSGIKKKQEESGDAHIAGSKAPMGPVFSTFTYEEEPGYELKLDAIHAFAREGDEEKLFKCVEGGVPLNLKDSEGRTPLHWAVDRGHMNVTALLLRKNADVNAKDNKGQTALHYAATCERVAIAELLVEKGADIRIKDDDGNTPGDLCELSWPWMQIN